MKRNRILCALLCAALLLTSCAGGQAHVDSTSGTEITQGAMGRWVEEAVDLGKPYNLLGAPTELADGTLCLYASDLVDDEVLVSQGMTLRQFTSADGGTTWQEAPCRLNTIECNFVNELAVSPGGNVLILGIAQDKDSRKYGVYYAAADGEPQPVAFDSESPLLQNDEGRPESFDSMSTNAVPLFPGQPQINKLGFLSDTLAYACITPTYSQETNSDIGPDITILFEPATGKILCKVDAGKGYSTGLLSAVGAYPGGLMHLVYDSATGNRTFYSVDTAGQSTMRVEGLTLDNSLQTAYADAQGNYYFITAGGIYRIAAGGALAELVVDSTGFTFSADNTIIWNHNLTYTSDGSFYVGVQGLHSRQIDLYRYRFDKAVPAVNEKNINVWSLRDNATLRAALITFNQTHKDVTVNFTLGLPNDAQGLNEEDVIRALNTQMLAGNGPDVLVFDGMDTSAYVDKGLLVDLSTQVDGSALAPFVKSAYYKAGETYLLPARFSVPVLLGPADKMDAITTLDALRDAVLACPPRPVMDCMSEQYYTPLADNEMYALGFYSVAQLTQFALQTSAPALLQNGKVDTASLTQLLGFIEAVGKYYSMGEYPPTFTSNGAVGGGSADACEWLDGGYEFNATGNAVYGWDVIHTPAYLSTSWQKSRDTQEFRTLNAILQPGLVSGAYLPRTLLGVSASSTQQETALAFVQTMFSSEVQKGFYQDGMPVLQSELEASIARNCKPEWLEQYNLKTQPETFFDGLQTPVVLDTQVQKSVTTHAQALVGGTETLEQAVAAVEKELGLYLAERG